MQRRTSACWKIRPYAYVDLPAARLREVARLFIFFVCLEGDGYMYVLLEDGVDGNAGKMRQ